MEYQMPGEIRPVSGVFLLRVCFDRENIEIGKYIQNDTVKNAQKYTYKTVY